MNSVTHLRDQMLRDGWTAEKFESFWAWHLQNPWVWKEFEELSLGLVERGKKKFGSKMVIEYIRYNATAKSKGDTEYKIQNSFTCAYSRMFALKYPQHATVFTLKSLGGIQDQYKESFINEEERWNKAQE